MESIKIKKICGEIVKKYSSPLIVYDSEQILNRIEKVKKAFQRYSKFKLLYSIKSNSNLSIINLINKQGIGIDACSPGDVFIALRSKVSKEEIYATGPNWSEEDLNYFIKKEIKVDLDSISAIEQYGLLNPNSEIGIRINPKEGFAFVNHLSAGDIDSKLGIPLERLQEAKKTAKKYGLKIIRLHYHVFSGCLDHTKIISVFKKFIEIAKEFPDLEEINIGGGWGTPFVKEERELEISKLAKEILKELGNLNSFFNKELGLIIESGEYIINCSGYAVGKITSIKKTKNKVHVGTNLNSNFMTGYYLYKIRYPLLDEEDSGTKVTIGGNLCQAGDIIAENRILDNFKIGDFLILKNVGAYASCRASHFNSRLKPTEILIDGDSSLEVIYKDKFENLIEGQKLI